MAKLLCFVASAVALVALATAFPQKQLRCTDTYATGLSTFQTMCADVVENNKGQSTSSVWKDIRQDTANPHRLLEKIEQCTCMILQSTMVWETMMTHEVEILHAVSRELIEEFEKEIETPGGKRTYLTDTLDISTTVRRDNPLFEGDDGSLLYHYYVLNHIFKSANTISRRRSFFKIIMQKVSKTYFNLDDLEMSYDGHENDDGLAEKMVAGCEELGKSFDPYQTVISNMRNVLDNKIIILAKKFNFSD